MTQIANTDMAAAWDGDEGAHWTEFEEHYSQAARSYQPHLMKAAAIGASDRVLDIGCGTGFTTREAARAASNGSALGVDLSGVMLERARMRAKEEGLTNVEFTQADAQVYPFERESFDLVMSRAGVMFFADPHAAFANIARAVRPGGRLALMVWQSVERNEWMREIFGALMGGKPLPQPAPGAPGPAGMADPALVETIVAGAGFEAPAFEEVEAPLHFGATADDAFHVMSRSGAVKGTLAQLDAEGGAALLDSLRAMFKKFETPDGVLLGAAAWIITARRP